MKTKVEEMWQSSLHDLNTRQAVGQYKVTSVDSKPFYSVMIAHDSLVSLFGKDHLLWLSCSPVHCGTRGRHDSAA